MASISAALEVHPRPVAAGRPENIPDKSNYGNSLKSRNTAGYHKTLLEEASITIREESYHRLRFKSASGMLLKAAPSSMKKAESRRDGRRPARAKKQKQKTNEYKQVREVQRNKRGQLRNVGG